MTKEQLDAIRARVEAATPGPWEAVTPKRYAAVRSDAERCYVYTQGKIPADTHPDTVARQQRDAQFIAAARQDIPALLAEVERLTAERDDAIEAARIRGANVTSKTLLEVVCGAMHDLLNAKAGQQDAMCVYERTKAEAERLTAERDAAFKRGVEAMREAAVTTLESAFAAGDNNLFPQGVAYGLRLVRALPDPEDRTSTEGKS